jgi:hypothetical protein
MLRSAEPARQTIPDDLPWYVRLLASQGALGYNAGDANLYRYVGNSPTNVTDPSGLEWTKEGVIAILSTSPLGQLTLKTLPKVTVYKVDYIKSYIQTREKETDPWPTEWKENYSSGLKDVELGRIIIYIPKDHSDFIAAWTLVHEATHARQERGLGIKGEYEAYINEAKWLIENPELMKQIPEQYSFYCKGKDAWIIETEKGKFAINEKNIKAWVDRVYSGYYTPSKLIRYKTDAKGRYVYEFGNKIEIKGWESKK